MILFVFDGRISTFVRSLSLPNDLRRELELLQQYGAPGSMIVTAAAIWLLDPARRRRLADWLLAAGLATASASILKIVVGRARPRFGDPTALLGPWGAHPAGSVSSADLWSMPSSHTAVAVVMSVFLIRLYPALRPLAIPLAMLVGICRVILGAHYPSDVFVGAIIGYVVADHVLERSWGTRFIALLQTIHRNLPSSPRQLGQEVGHLVAAARYTIPLLIDHSQVSNTQRYGSHLCHLTYFRNAFREHLQARPERIERWLRRQVFIDYSPDHEVLARLPAATVGREYHRMCMEHAAAGRPDLRHLRLRILPEEAKELDLDGTVRMVDSDAVFERIVARRNIFSSASHDLRHLLLGADTSPAGEALVGRYEYLHLLEPGDLLNMVNAVALLALTGRWHALQRVLRAFKSIASSNDPTQLDIDTLWDLPLADARRALGLPPEGLMPGER